MPITEKTTRNGRKSNSLERQNTNSTVSLHSKNHNRKPKKTVLPNVNECTEERQNHLFQLCDKIGTEDTHKQNLLEFCQKSARSISFTPPTPPPSPQKYPDSDYVFHSHNCYMCYYGWKKHKKEILFQRLIRPVRRSCQRGDSHFWTIGCREPVGTYPHICLWEKYENGSTESLTR